MILGAMAGGKAVEDTATGNPVAFLTDLAKPLKSLIVNFLPVQQGSGDASPENERPIIGWNGLDVNYSEKNLLNPVWWDDVTANWSWVNYLDGTDHLQGRSFKASGYVRIVGNAEYTLHAGMTAQNEAGMAFYDADKQYISGILMKSATIKDYTFTTPSNAVYMRFSTFADIVPFDEVMLVYGSTAPTTYEPYNGTVYPVVFPALGKNLFNKNDPSIKTGVWLKGSVLTDAMYSNYKASEKIPVIPGQTYYLNRTSTGQGAVCYFDSDGVYVGQQTWDNYNPSRTIPSGVYYIAFTVDADALDTAMFEKGSSASSYEPFTNTVFGGYYNLITGELWATYYLASAHKSDFGDVQSGAIDYRQTPQRSYPASDSGTNWNMARQQQKFNMGAIANPWGETSYGENIAVIVTQSNDAGTQMRISEAVYQAMGDDDTADVSYKLASPVLITTLTQEQITAIKGNNTVWSDSNGSMTVTFLKKK